MPSSIKTLRMPAGSSVAAMAGLATSLLLAGCGPKADVFAPQCPDMKLLGDASDLTRFKGTGRDVTDMVLDARITAVPGSCKAAPGGKVAATIRVEFEATREPALQGRDVQL